MNLYKIELLLKLFKYKKCLATVKKKLKKKNRGRKEIKENCFRHISFENLSNYIDSKKQLLKMTIIRSILFV